MTTWDMLRALPYPEETPAVAMAYLPTICQYLECIMITRRCESKTWPMRQTPRAVSVEARRVVPPVLNPQKELQ